MADVFRVRNGTWTLLASQLTQGKAKVILNCVKIRCPHFAYILVILLSSMCFMLNKTLINPLAFFK